MDTTLEDRLSNLFYRSNCPDVVQLRDYQFALLDAETNKVVAEHVGICPHCMAELAELADFIASSERAAKRAPKPIGLRERFRTVIAMASASFLNENVQGAYRSKTRGEPPKSFWFDAEGTFINLEWRPDDHGRYRVYGQVLGGSEGDQLTLATVTLTTKSRHVALDEESAFEIEAVNGGTYQITIQSEEQKIVIPSVTISQLPTE